MKSKYRPKWLDKRDPVEWLMRRVVKTKTCWLFQTSAIYGEIIWENKRWGASQYSYTIFRGPIPPGKFVLHTCDVPRCVNPDHLFLGTQKENIQDAISKGRFGVYTEERRQRASQNALRFGATKEYKQIQSKNSLRMWSDPAFKKKRSQQTKLWWAQRKQSDARD